MIKAFRIAKAKHSRTAFSGEGAREAGGRWNFPGDAIVYSSSTLSLAALETFVHLSQEAQALEFVCFEVRLHESLPTERVEKPPAGWRMEPPGPASMRVGSKWFKERRTAGLWVPSALVPQEFNLMLNPAHPDFVKMEISRPSKFSFDARMWK